MHIRIKPYTDEYLEGLTNLMNQWHPSFQWDADSIQNSIFLISQESKAQILMAVDELNNPVGYVFITSCYHLGFEPFMEVVQILVDYQFHNKGIGRSLMSAVENFTKEKGFNIVKLSSRIEKEEAHEFYLKMGYKKFKESIFFEKELGGIF